MSHLYEMVIGNARVWLKLQPSCESTEQGGAFFECRFNGNDCIVEPSDLPSILCVEATDFCELPNDQFLRANASARFVGTLTSGMRWAAVGAGPGRRRSGAAISGDAPEVDGAHYL